MLLDVIGPVEEKYNAENPFKEVENRGYSHEHKPEPHEKVDFLVENVDCHYTLNCVVVGLFT